MTKRRKPAPEPWWLEGVEIVFCALVVLVPMVVMSAAYRGVTIWEVLTQ